MSVKEKKIATTDEAAALPEGWQVVRFDEMAQLVNDRVDNPSEADVDRYVGLEHLDPESLKIRRWGTPDDVEAQKLRFQPGDIIFGKRRAYQRKLAVADFEGICSAHAMVLRAREETVTKEFLPVFMQSDRFFECALSISVGSLSPTINWKTLAAQEFVIPPKREQQRIAEILWAAEDERQLLDKAELEIEKTKALLVNLLISSKSSNLSTELWEKVAIRDLGEVVTGSTPNTRKREFYGEDVMFVAPADISDSQWVRTTEKYLSVSGLKEVREIPPNSVMVVCIGSTIGKVAMASERCATNQQINSVICNATSDPVFVYYLLKAKANEFRRMASCTAVPILNKSSFSNIHVPKPPLSEQKKIADIANRHDQALERLRDKREKVIRLKALLTKHLIKGVDRIVEHV